MNPDGDIALVSKLHAIKSGKKREVEVWSFPKGQIETGEPDLIAARREIVEETGIEESDLEMLKYLGEFSRISTDRREWKHVMMFLFATTYRGDLQPIDRKMYRALWVSRKRVNDRLSHDADRIFFEQTVTKKLLRIHQLV